MSFTFDNNNTFRNVGIHNGNNELIVMNINASSDNISLHSSSNSSNVDTLSIKNILHKNTTKDLNICGYDGNNINPIIQINNTHQHINITSNLNVASNLNVSKKIKAQEIKINGIYINNTIGKFNVFSETTKTYTTTPGTINSKIDTVNNINGSSTNVSVRVIDINTSQQDIMQPMYINPVSGSVGDYTTTNITSGAIINNGTIGTFPTAPYPEHNNINFTSNVCWCSEAQPSPANIDEIDYFITIDLSLSAKIYGIVTWPRKENSGEIYAGVSKFAISYSDDDVYYKFVCNGESNIYHKSTLCFGPNSILSSNDPQPIEFLANDYASSFSAKPTNWETLSQIGVANYFNIKSRYVRIHIREIYGNRNNIQIRAHVIVDSNTNFQIANFNTGSVVVGGLSSTISTLGELNDHPVIVFGLTGIDVNGISKFNKGIDVTGDTTLSNTLNVTGDTTLSNTLNVTGDTTLSNTLNVTGATTIDDRIIFKLNTNLEKNDVTDTTLAWARFLHKITYGKIYMIADYLEETGLDKYLLRNFVTMNQVVSGTNYMYYGWKVSGSSAYSYSDLCENSIGTFGAANSYETLAYLKMSVYAIPSSSSDHDFLNEAQTLNFTGQHRCVPNNIELFNNVDNYIGYIVCSSGKYKSYNVLTKQLLKNKAGILINESLPIIELSNKKQKKNVFGVISNKEEEREYAVGAFVTRYPTINDEKRLYINSVGEGAIWIVNTNGNLENGDYIQSSNVAGHGEKQDSEFLANYTVSKITCDCNFTLNSEDYNCIEFIDSASGNTYRKAFVGCTYHCG